MSCCNVLELHNACVYYERERQTHLYIAAVSQDRRWQTILAKTSTYHTEQTPQPTEHSSLSQRFLTILLKNILICFVGEDKHHHFDFLPKTSSVQLCSCELTDILF